MNTQNPIQMPNRALAMGLVSAGATFAKGEEGGPCINVYTPDFLRSKGVISEGVTELEFERAAILAEARGIIGNVTFFFERNALAEGFVKAWDATSDAIRANREYAALDAETQRTHDKPAALPDVPTEIVAQVLCMHANNLKSLKGIERSNPPVCSTLKGAYDGGKPGKETSTGVCTGRLTGAGKIWSTNLSNADRAKLKIHPKPL